ncbi:hypothetical protein [Arthrobacter sp.]|uniref:hypothetical protein n=1 Tax=Arthrobacter sp. TaxID=1667 RepID=UPI003A8FA472
MSHTSTGGVTSVDYQFDEFERAAVLLARAEHSLGMVRMLLSSALADAGPPSWRDVWQFSRAVEDHLRTGNALANEVEDRLAHCRIGLETSRASYEDAERRARQQAFQVRSETTVPRLVHELASNHGHPDGQTMEDLINAAPGYALSLLLLCGAPMRLASGHPEPPPIPAAVLRFLARAVADRDHGGPFTTGIADRLATNLASHAALRQLLNVRRIRVASVSRAQPEPFTGTLPDLMSLQQRAEAQVSGDGAVLVSTTQTPAGPVHVLTLPGTQPAEDRLTSLPVNPFDEGGIVEAAGLDSRYVGEAAAEALHAAGAQPGDRLVITGYSQGGIHAANLAVDPRIARMYDVEYVVTSGAPVGGIPLPDGVRGLHMEHVDDMVPGLDGRPNPDSRNQVTVRFTGYAPGTDMEAGGFGAAHQLGNYTALSEELATSTEPNIVEDRQALGAVFAGATTVSVTTVALRRGRAREVARIKPVRRQRRGPLRRGLHAAPAH